MNDLIIGLAQMVHARGMQQSIVPVVKQRPSTRPEVLWIDAELDPHGYVHARTKSWTGQPRTYDIYVRPQDMRVTCSCDSFDYRYSRFKPTLGDSEHVCKHVRSFAYALALHVAELNDLALKAKETTRT